jgi:hypothetical protein
MRMPATFAARAVLELELEVGEHGHEARHLSPPGRAACLPACLRRRLVGSKGGRRLFRLFSDGKRDTAAVARPRSIALYSFSAVLIDDAALACTAKRGEKGSVCVNT